MKVELVKQKVSNNYGGDYRYKILNISPCCDEIRDSKSVQAIHPIELDEYKGEDNLPVVAICWSEYEWCYEDAFEYDCAEQIKFCPFCGKPVVVEVVKWEDITEHMTDLEAQVNKLRKLYNNSDSIKEREELNEEINGLQNEIDYYFLFGVYQEN